MIAKEQLEELRLKILPAGSAKIVDLLIAHYDRVVPAKVAMEGVPLVIIARHGVLARLPIKGVMTKLSSPEAITTPLQHFFQGRETLYLYTNLPALTVPDCVQEVLDEAASRLQSTEELKRRINAALDAMDRETFMRLSAELRERERISERIRFDVR
ncbi:MAG: IDEAL domain-containing protein [Firmicutes bacterium]|nr:IDEAL domain-containing protein [Bacillota bacterium]